MSVSPEELRQGLDEAGIPPALLPNLESELPDPILKQRYMAASDLMKEMPVLQVIGHESPLKDLVCAKLLRRYMWRTAKTGRWLTPARIAQGLWEIPKGAGVVVIVGIDLLTPQQVKVVSHMLRDWIPMGRAFILSVSSTRVLENLFGEPMTQYLNHYSSIVEIDTPRAEPVRV